MFVSARFLRLLILLVFLPTAACTDRPPELSDEELVLLLGNSLFGSRAKLTRRTVECVRLIGGLDQDVYKDADKTVLGTIRTQCRRTLDANLKDQKLNPKGLKLVHFEDPALAERISALDVRLEKEQAMRQAKEEAERIAAERLAAEKRIADVKRRVEAVAVSFDESLSTSEKDCREWSSIREKIVAANRSSGWRWRSEPAICSPRVRSETRAAVLRAVQLVQSVRVNENGTASIPFLGNGDPADVKARFDDLRARLDEIRAAAPR